MQAPVGCDQIAERVGVEGVIWPIEEYCSYVDKSVYQIIKMKSHLKTHIETPWHLNHVGRCLSDYEPETFYGRCVRLHFDVEPGTIITREMTEKADNGRIKKGDIVIAHTTVDENLMSTVFKSEVFGIFLAALTIMIIENLITIMKVNRYFYQPVLGVIILMAVLIDSIKSKRSHG